VEAYTSSIMVNSLRANLHRFCAVDFLLLPVCLPLKSLSLVTLRKAVDEKFCMFYKYEIDYIITFFLMKNTYKTGLFIERTHCTVVYNYYAMFARIKMYTHVLTVQPV
jgi:hypothetical protein